MRKAATSRARGRRHPSKRRGPLMRALSLPLFLLAVVYRILNPFRRKAPTAGLRVSRTFSFCFWSWHWSRAT